MVDDVIEVSEAEIASAIRLFAETVHQMAEGAGAAALAGASAPASPPALIRRVGIVLSGGNITSAQLRQILHGEVRSGGARQHAAAAAAHQHGNTASACSTATRRA